MNKGRRLQPLNFRWGGCGSEDPKVAVQERIPKPHSLALSSTPILGQHLPNTFFGMQLFTYNWKLPAYVWASLLRVLLWSFCLQFELVCLYLELFFLQLKLFCLQWECVCVGLPKRTVGKKHPAVGIKATTIRKRASHLSFGTFPCQTIPSATPLNSPDRGQSPKIRFSKLPGSGLKKI